MEKEMKLYSIGEMSKICKVSQKTLRYYDEIGILKADIHDELSGYRYYTEKAFGQFMAIKYYQAAGLSLDNITYYQKATNFNEFIDLFRESIQQKDYELKKIKLEKESLEQWLLLMEEGKEIFQQTNHSINIKKMRQIKTLSAGTLAYGHNLSEPLSVRDKYLRTGQMVYGAAYLEIPSMKKVLNNESQIVFRHMEIHPASFNGIDYDEIGGFVALSMIQTGSLDSIEDIYVKMINEAEKRNLKLRGDVIERYIVDACTTKDDQLFATEILMPIHQ